MATSSPERKLHFYIYDRNHEFRDTFSTLLKEQQDEEGAVCVGDAGSDLTVQATVVNDKGYLMGYSLAPAVAGLSIGAIVSPGTSFGIMEGGLDLAISKYYSSLFGLGIEPRVVTLAVQKALLHRPSGGLLYNPVQHAERIPAETLLTNIQEQLGATRTASGLPAYFDDRSDVPDLIHLPTMATPSSIYHGEYERLCNSLVFNCTWNLLANLNQTHLSAAEVERPTLNVMLTGMGTGIGKVPPKISALYMFKAMYYFARILRMKKENTAVSDIARYTSGMLRDIPILPGQEYSEFGRVREGAEAEEGDSEDEVSVDEDEDGEEQQNAPEAPQNEDEEMTQVD